MTALEATAEDIRAATDLLRFVTDRSDSLDGAMAIEFVAAIDELRSVANTARDMLAMRLVGVLEKPKVFEDRLYFVEDNVRRRDNHGKIAREVVDRACVDRMSGVVLDDPRTAAARAVRMMVDLYVSPSTTSKKTVLAELKIEDVVDEQKVEGRKLTVRPLKAK